MNENQPNPEQQEQPQVDMPSETPETVAASEMSEVSETQEVPIADAEHQLELEGKDERTQPAAEQPPAPVEMPTPLPVTPEAPARAPEPVVPIVQPVVPAAVPVATEHSSGGVLVLQWLSYAFWFWYTVAISVLAGITINFLFSSDTSSGVSTGLAYSLASVIITLAIALVTDKLYAKHEPAKKTGGANVIMLLHVVPFILMAIGAVVTIVFSLISMFLDSSPLATTDGPIQVILVSLVILLLLGLVAARALYGGTRTKLRVATWLVAALLAVGFMAGAIIGPAATAMRTKNDRLIEEALPTLASDIREYTRENDKLPSSVTDVTHTSSYSSELVQKLIDSNLVTYKPNTLPSATSSTSPTDINLNSCVADTSGACYNSTAWALRPGIKRYYYQLCVNYTNEKKSTYNYTDEKSYMQGDSVGTSADYTNSYVYGISAHPAGEVCYNLYADGSYDSAN